MDDQIMEDLAGFDTLWQRVKAVREDDTPACAGPERTYAWEDALLRLIHDETCACSASAALARLCQGDGRALLLRHAADAKRHLRRLRAEYFILTGLAAGPNVDCRPVSGDRAACLRHAYRQACGLAERYDTAAEHADCPELHELLHTFAGDERRRAQQLRALLIDSF